MSQPSGRMVTGFNHNIKHKGQVFHVQTEDSGVSTPHIITHMFMGGNILASKKTSYADIVHAENLPQVVRAMMEEQHKEMLRNLINGAYDEIIRQYNSKAWQPGILESGEAPELTTGGTAARGQGAPPASPAPPAAAPPAAPPPTPQQAPAAAQTPRAAPPPRAPTPPPITRSLPPEVVAAQNLTVKPQPKDGGDTIFGEDLISERSLDEVILSYLAEDGTES